MHRVTWSYRVVALKKEQRRLLRMDFRTFRGAFINIPCQILHSGRRLIYRLLAWNPWQYLFLRFVDAT